MSEFRKQLQEKKYASEAAARYGLAYALLQAKDVAAAQKEIAALMALKASSPMIAGLAARAEIAAGNPSGAEKVYRESLLRFPQSKALAYGYAEALLAGRQYQPSLQFIESQLQLYSWDYKLYGLQAQTFAALGKRLQQHRSQAEFYLLQGQLGAAVEQLQFAQQAGDGDFFEKSAVDARLRDLRKLLAEEVQEKKRNGG